MRLLILVLGTRAKPFPALVDTIRATWATLATPGVETLFYYGATQGITQPANIGDELTLPAPDDAYHIGYKTLACFEYLLENREFDVVFRTNCSSYVHPPNLRDVVSRQKDPRMLYGGFIGSRDSQPFASGSGYFLGRELMQTVVERRAGWVHKMADDQALAAVLRDAGIRPQPMPRQDFRRVPAIDEVDLQQFHFRCRTDSFRRRIDRRIMRQVHRAFLRSRAA